MKYCFLCFILCSGILGAQPKFVDITGQTRHTEFKSAAVYGSGVSAEDFDGDGDLDLAIPTDFDASARILINRMDGSFDEITFDLGFNSRAALWVDFNGDHKLDLIFAGDCLEKPDCNKGIAIFQQMGDGTLLDVTNDIFEGVSYGEASTIFGGITAGDITENGYLDIYLVYLDIPSILLQNQGDGNFKVIHNYFSQNGFQKHWTPILYDLNRDGWLDFYQAVDLGWPNEFWYHTGNMHYKEAAAEFGLDHSKDNMGITLGDYDNDSDLDIFVSNIEGKDDPPRGSVLLRNDDFQFFNEGVETGLYKSGWGWGVTFMDGDNDGLLDVALTNGSDGYGADASKFWLNNGDATFTDMSAKVGFNDTSLASGLIALDLDRDGDLDLIQTLKSESHRDGIRFYRNDLDQTENQNYIVVQPRMAGTNHWAIGSMVKIRAGDNVQIRPITAGISYFGQEPAEAFFGLGSSDHVDEVEITWPGGAKSVFQDFDANQVIRLFDDDALHPPLALSWRQDPLDVQFTWKLQNENALMLLMERSKDSLFSSSDTYILASNVTEFTDTAAEVGQTYYYRLFSKKDDEQSRASATRVVYVSEPLVSPLSLTAELISVNSVGLSWIDRSDNEDGFIIRRSANESFDRFLELSVGANREGFIDNTLEPGGAYYYKIQSVSEFGASSFSEAIFADLANLVLSADQNEAVVVFPNPVKDVFTVIIENGESIQSYYLSDISGRELNNTLVNYDLTSSFVIIKTVAPGLYLLNLEFESGWQSIRMVIK